MNVKLLVLYRPMLLLKYGCDPDGTYETTETTDPVLFCFKQLDFCSRESLGILAACSFELSVLLVPLSSSWCMR